MLNIHPVDQLRIYYAQSIELPRSPERALSAEAWLHLIREETTEAERLDAWRRLAQMPAVKR